MNKTQFNEFNDEVKKMFASKAQRLLERFLEFVDLIEDAKSFTNRENEFKILEKEFLNVFELSYRDEFGDPDYDDCYMDLVGLVQAMTIEIEKLFERRSEYYKEYEKSKKFKLDKEKLYLKIKEFYIPKIIKCLVEEYKLKLEYFNSYRFSNHELKELINKL